MRALRPLGKSVLGTPGAIEKSNSMMSVQIAGGYGVKKRKTVCTCVWVVPSPIFPPDLRSASVGLAWFGGRRDETEMATPGANRCQKRCHSKLQPSLLLTLWRCEDASTVDVIRFRALLSLLLTWRWRRVFLEEERVVKRHGLGFSPSLPTSRHNAGLASECAILHEK